MQALINRTNGIAEGILSSAVGGVYLASYLGFSYLALSVATSFFARLIPRPVSRSQR